MDSRRRVRPVSRGISKSVPEKVEASPRDISECSIDHDSRNSAREVSAEGHEPIWRRGSSPKTGKSVHAKLGSLDSGSGSTSPSFDRINPPQSPTSTLGSYATEIGRACLGQESTRLECSVPWSSTNCLWLDSRSS